ncbi:MAG: diguanylate cyclase (GGDEF)-like protein [Halieaceae bacterium]|jgi:diguanylate cyclase (GGDEF)-like protein
MLNAAVIRLTALLALAVYGLLAGAAAASPPSPASATIRVVPLSTAEEGVSLAGDWRFQPGDDMLWAAPEFDDQNWNSQSVPGLWPKGGYPESNQFGWYRLNLMVDLAQEQAAGEQLGLQIGKVMNAYELYAGGELLGHVGKFPPLAEIDYDREKVFVLPASAIGEDGSLVLALRVWGGSQVHADNWRMGPFDGDFVLGSYSQLLTASIRKQLPGVMICILFVGFGVYLIYLYSRNRQLNTYLWFGLLAINIGVYGLLLNQWKYGFDWSFLAMKKLEFGVIYLFPALSIQAVWKMLDAHISRLLRAYQLSFVAAALVVVAVPGHQIHIQSLGYWQVWSLPALALVTLLMLQKVQQGHSEAKTLIVGLLIFIAACINDLLIDFVGAETSRLMPYGFLAVMLSMSISLANRFTTSISKLEIEVADRTSALIAANKRLAEAAKIDPLTGLYNRRGFTQEAETEIKRVFRNGRGFSVILSDVDNFKKFNDQYGHACGDHVLMLVSESMRGRLRDVDRAARWGGEEFIFLLPETDSEGATALAEELRASVADNLFEFESIRQRITMTFGVAEHQTGEALEACIARADKALYEGKESGRNKVTLGS